MDVSLDSARERLERRVRGVLLQGFGIRHADGLTTEALGERIGMSDRRVRGYLFGPFKLTLRVISDLAHGMGFELSFRVVPIADVAASADADSAADESQPS